MLNSIQLMGRLTAEPEMQTANEYAISRFTLAVPRDYKNRDGERDTDFIRVVAWNATAKFVTDYLSKGQKIVVVGALRTRAYTDKEGKNRVATEVVANNIYFAENKTQGQPTAAQENEDTPVVGSLQNSEEYKDLYESLSTDDDYPF